MFFSARKNHQIPQDSEIEYLRDKIEGPFFPAKIEISVSDEFQRLLKRFEKRLANKKFSPVLSENIEKKPSRKSPIQVKIVNVFTHQKSLNKS